jgi:hypothetical protein
MVEKKTFQGNSDGKAIKVILRLCSRRKSLSVCGVLLSIWSWEGTGRTEKMPREEVSVYLNRKRDIPLGTDINSTSIPRWFNVISLI